MISRARLLALLAAAPPVLAAASASSLGATGAAPSEAGRLVLSDADWRKRLAPQRYEILRRAGTEPAFSSPLDTEKRAGTYACAGCDLALFSSATKFDSGTGWPSFYRPLPHAVETSVDRSYLMVRTEVHCRRCAGHLGHVFDDGPPPTGLRYCMNGLALTFKPKA